MKITFENEFNKQEELIYEIGLEKRNGGVICYTDEGTYDVIMENAYKYIEENNEDIIEITLYAY